MSTQAPPQLSESLTLPDGRTLGYSICSSAASSDTPTIFYFHGFPSSRYEGFIWLGTSVSPQINARCISIDRPGIGLSTFQPNRRILDFPADVLALADHLKVEKFHVMGTSGGAPYALVCTKEIPSSRLLSTAVISGIYPPDLSREGMLVGLRALLFVGYWAPTSMMASMFDWKFGRAARNPDPKVLEDIFMKEMQGRPAKDLECLENEEFRKYMVKATAEAFKQGGFGPAWDFRLYGDDWGFDLKDVDGTNVTLWHGMGDVNTPYGMALQASKLISGCQFKAFEKETHMSLPFIHAGEILEGLLKPKV